MDIYLHTFISCQDCFLLLSYFYNFIMGELFFVSKLMDITPISIFSD